MEMMLRGQIYYADLGTNTGSEQSGMRPVLIIQNDIGNRYSPTIIVASLTSQISKAKLPTHIPVSAAKYSLEKDSVILMEQIRTIDKKRLKGFVCMLNKEIMEKVDMSISISLGIAG